MDHINSGGPPTVHTQNFYQLWKDFPVRLGTDTLSKVVQAKYERMKEQSFQAHSFPRNSSRNKQNKIVRTH
jgi:hypothetical protein